MKTTRTKKPSAKPRTSRASRRAPIEHVEPSAPSAPSVPPVPDLAHVRATHLPHQGLVLVAQAPVVEDEIDLDAVTATWPDDPWRALLAEVRDLEDAIQGVVYQGAEGRDGGELVEAVQHQLLATLARAAGLPALRPVLALAPSQEDAP